VIVTAPVVKRETYEFAAWFRDHELKPGTYPVKYETYNGYPYHYLRVEVPSTIKNACLVSCFGGVQYGPDTAGQREIGKDSTYTMGKSLGYKLSAVDRGLTIDGHEFVPCI
jgi:hypothetical protein